MFSRSLPFPTHPLTHPTPGPRRVRTVDLTINSRSLYQLSYGTQTKTTQVPDGFEPSALRSLSHALPTEL